MTKAISSNLKSLFSQISVVLAAFLTGTAGAQAADVAPLPEHPYFQCGLEVSLADCTRLAEKYISAELWAAFDKAARVLDTNTKFHEVKAPNCHWAGLAFVLGGSLLTEPFHITPEDEAYQIIFNAHKWTTFSIADTNRLESPDWQTGDLFRVDLDGTSVLFLEDAGGVPRKVFHRMTSSFHTAIYLENGYVLEKEGDTTKTVRITKLKNLIAVNTADMKSNGAFLIHGYKIQVLRLEK